MALIKSNLSKDISLESLGKIRACHPAAGDSVGWTIPVGLLIGNDVMPWKNCNPYQSSADYFLESCVPGLLQDKERTVREKAKFDQQNQTNKH